MFFELTMFLLAVEEEAILFFVKHFQHRDTVLVLVARDIGGGILHAITSQHRLADTSVYGMER